MMLGSRLLSHRHLWHGGPRVCGGDPVSQMARRSQLVQDEDVSCRCSLLVLLLSSELTARLIEVTPSLTHGSSRVAMPGGLRCSLHCEVRCELS